MCITVYHACVEGTRTAGSLAQSAPQHYSFCLLYHQAGAPESRGSQPGLCSASRTQRAHYLHARVKVLSTHQALTRLGVNRQSLTSNRIHDQSQLCRNTGKVAVGKAPGNNRWLRTRVSARSVLIAHAPRVLLPAKSRRPLGRPQFPGQGKLEAAPRALRPRRTGRRQPRSALREPRCPRRARGNAAARGSHASPSRARPGPAAHGDAPAARRAPASPSSAALSGGLRPHQRPSEAKTIKKYSGMVAVTSSYKTKELTFVGRVLRQKVKETEALREKTMHKGERRHEEGYLEEKVKMQKEQIHKWKSNQIPEQLKIYMKHFDNTKIKVTKIKYEIKK
ncbi:uncharacterized protein [Anomalospiza imberbis]|uniref:uncharacterized protein n=1 Tax=Anomalospiza imberbis TaxID=187417 RepID=UPI00358FB8C2